MRYEIKIDEYGYKIIRYSKVITDEGEEEIEEIYLERTADDYESILGVYEPFPKDMSLRYVGNLDDLKIAKGTEMRTSVPIPLSICKAKYLKKLEYEDERIVYLDINGAPIQRGIIVGIVVGVQHRKTSTGKDYTIFRVFDGYDWGRLRLFGIKADPELYTGLFIRGFVRFGYLEYGDEEEKVGVSITLNDIPVIIQPKEYFVHKNFIDSSIIPRIKEDTDDNNSLSRG
ncbi:conserved hypothetical protein [Methanocaldococcus infernus ME]|uniref:Uncharacterized protein n=1 Tax=Methanocaldococcus infernus (strain DSM 11812 / JCM 15783 / ME) TaxID=573063 RepID=D5VS77_METIM|nr:hypothetical protein [Methanocaldococcus infernus]ADG13430.1 conserved hypothetical protein [Methanocaldococcus infernus ME]